ncbi:MAG: mechanosensitive ion channel family protein [Desulfobacterales bacterium]|nr:mechanosensitive ion channel family protein [Desulfobacterales bacterium]
MENEIEIASQSISTIMNFFVNYGFQVAGAVIILVIGILVAKWISGLIINLCLKRKLDVTLSHFLGNMVKIIILAFVIIIALGKFGVSIAPMIAAIGALAFGASFALQGPLSNYGAGLVIIMTRPFVIDNTISINGVSGVVEVITLSSTTLDTEDGEKVTIPNKHIIGEILTNSFSNKVVEAVVGISYNSDPNQAIQIIQDALNKVPHIYSEKPAQIGIHDFGDSSINIGMRYWVPTQQYFQTRYAANLAVFNALRKAEINIPFPQRDVHMVS